jgi:hypothetical protein
VPFQLPTIIESIGAENATFSSQKAKHRGTQARYTHHLGVEAGIATEPFDCPKTGFRRLSLRPAVIGFARLNPDFSHCWVCQFPLALEDEVNAWLQENPNVSVVHIKQSAGGSSFWSVGDVFISVWYEEEEN